MQSMNVKGDSSIQPPRCDALNKAYVPRDNSLPLFGWPKYADNPLLSLCGKTVVFPRRTDIHIALGDNTLVLVLRVVVTQDEYPMSFLQEFVCQLPPVGLGPLMEYLLGWIYGYLHLIMMCLSFAPGLTSLATVLESWSSFNFLRRNFCQSGTQLDCILPPMRSNSICH